MVALAWLGVTVQEAAAGWAPCWPGECNVQSHREMVLTVYAEVDPKLDAVVVGRIKAVRHLYGNDEVGATESRYLWADVLVDRSLAGCFRTGDRLVLAASGYGGWHWRARSPADMAPVLAIAEANMALEREADARDDRHSLVYEVPKHLKRNRTPDRARGGAAAAVRRVEGARRTVVAKAHRSRAGSWPALPHFHAEHRKDESFQGPPKQLPAHVRHLPCVSH